MLVAPVTRPGATTATAYVPSGSWEHVWSGTRYTGSDTGKKVAVDAKLGYPPVFLRTDAADFKQLRDELRKVPLV